MKLIDWNSSANSNKSGKFCTTESPICQQKSPLQILRKSSLMFYMKEGQGQEWVWPLRLLILVNPKRLPLTVLIWSGGRDGTCCLQRFDDLLSILLYIISLSSNCLVRQRRHHHLSLIPHHSSVNDNVWRTTTHSAFKAFEIVRVCVCACVCWGRHCFNERTWCQVISIYCLWDFLFSCFNVMNQHFLLFIGSCLV